MMLVRVLNAMPAAIFSPIATQPPAFGTSEVSKGRTPRPPYLMTKSFALDGKREPNMGRTSLAGKVRKKNHATLQTAKGYLILISPADFHPEERVSPLGHEVEYSDKPELVFEQFVEKMRKLRHASRLKAPYPSK
jgi:hypothetical protein